MPTTVETMFSVTTSERKATARGLPICPAASSNRCPAAPRTRTAGPVFRRVHQLTAATRLKTSRSLPLVIGMTSTADRRAAYAKAFSTAGLSATFGPAREAPQIRAEMRTAVTICGGPPSATTSRSKQQGRNREGHPQWMPFLLSLQGPLQYSLIRGLGG